MADDHRCVQCGYNLRGLEPTGNCPECAAPVGDSLVGDDLRHADQPWLRTVRTGLVLLAMAAGAICAWLFLVMLAFISALLDARNESPFIEPTVALAPVIALGSAVGASIGILLFTTLEPVERVRPPVRARLVARRLTWVVVALWIAAALLGAAWSVDVFVDGRLLLGLCAVAVLAGLAMVVVACHYMGHLLHRSSWRKKNVTLVPFAGALFVGIAVVCWCAATHYPLASSPMACFAVLGAISLMIGGLVTPIAVLVLAVRTYRVVDRVCDDGVERHGRTPPDA